MNIIIKNVNIILIILENIIQASTFQNNQVNNEMHGTVQLLKHFKHWNLLCEYYYVRITLLQNLICWNFYFILSFVTAKSVDLKLKYKIFLLN